MKKIIVLIIIFIIGFSVGVYAKGAHVSAHSSTHVSTPKSATSKSTINGAKTYTTPKSFTSKYNASDIKTEKVQESVHYSNYNSSNIFKPNFWTAMWAFQCMHDNTEEVTEQDIAKELEERGYSQEEIQDILKEGEQAKEEIQLQKEEENKFTRCMLIFLFIIIVLTIFFAVISE